MFGARFDFFWAEFLVVFRNGAGCGGFGLPGELFVGDVGSKQHLRLLEVGGLREEFQAGERI